MFLVETLQRHSRQLARKCVIGMAAGLFLAGAAQAERRAPLPTVAIGEMPAEAQRVHRVILAGGPFDYPKDGIVFANREHLLASKPRGFYREYTVSSPGAHNRGARRIVCGGTQPANPAACFYTDDHYASFRQIAN